jgi:beta-phosphoglucomutase
MEAVIFDMDGVLVDSYRAHFESWRQLAATDGMTLTETQFAETFGRTSADIIRKFWRGETLTDARVREIDDRKEALYRRSVSREFPEMDGARDLVRALRTGGVRVAVGSSGPPENVDLAIERLGGSASFDAAVTGMDVTRGKPDPQVFLLAAERVGAAPARSVVIEDAPDGILAARAAGMASVALVSTGRRTEDFDEATPDLVVHSLRELSPMTLEALVASKRGPSE